MAVLRPRMRLVCERHRAKRLQRVQMRVVGDSGRGPTAREATHVRRKVCSALTVQLIRQRTLTAKAV
jgi:hypothetical protein